jgi:hypothetical protein
MWAIDLRVGARTMTVVLPSGWQAEFSSRMRFSVSLASMGSGKLIGVHIR